MAKFTDTELIEAVQKRRLNVDFQEEPPHYVSVSDSEFIVVFSPDMAGDENKITDWRQAVTHALSIIEDSDAEQPRTNFTTEAKVTHYADKPGENDDGYSGPGWYFWDEAWFTRYGPYETEEQANEKLKEYCKKYLE